MATRNGVICNGRVVPSYISSNSYYGYVPPVSKYNESSQACVQDKQQIMKNGAIHPPQNQRKNITTCLTNTRFNATPVQRCYQINDNHQHHQDESYFCDKSSSMETDDDQHLHDVTRIENNHYVIPETARLFGNDPGGFGNYHLLEDQQNVGFDRCKNRKRNNSGDLMVLFGQPTGQMKKFKPGGGNRQVCRDSRSPRDFGSSPVHNESPSLRIISNQTTGHIRYSYLVDGCCTKAAGNIGYSSLIKENVGKEQISCVLNERINHVDYEEMLMETHGCSAYHFHLHQQATETDI